MFHIFCLVDWFRQKQQQHLPLCNEQTKTDEDGDRVADRTIPTKEDPLSPPQATTSAVSQVARYNEICHRSEDVDEDNRDGDDEDGESADGEVDALEKALLERLAQDTA